MDASKPVFGVLVVCVLYTALLVGITAILLATVAFGLALVGQEFTAEWVAAVSPLAVAAGFVVWSVHKEYDRRKRKDKGSPG